jgi:asparagine synthase (glutamine-hydrolysing)
MCGVAGLIRLTGEPVPSATLKRMTDAISHRGPDGEGQWIEGNVGLGHRRLSIIDLSSAGNQPMVSKDGGFVLSFNGEIYNFRELRAQLEKDGFRFKSKTDTEVVLYALIHWGFREALLKFNGMFALALWDRKRSELLLARDRFGVKPIYYSLQGGTFAFGSEQKAILAMPDFTRALNSGALLEYFTFQNLFTDQTFFEDIKILPAGHYGVLSLGNKNPQLNLHQYWDYVFRESTSTGSPEECVEELDRLFQQAVNRQLMSDVELGCYLSGGMDSGAVAAVAASRFKYLKTFTVGFDLSSASGIELNYDERPAAEALSGILKTEHYEVVLKSGDMERCLPSLTHHLEDPRVGQSYPNFYAAKLASRFVKVVLGGGGGDELFAGYPWRYYRSAGSQSFDEYIDNYYGYWQRLASNAELKRLFSPIGDDVKDVWTRDIFAGVFKSHQVDLEQTKDYINHSLYFEAKTFLHGLFVVEDKLSMAHGLESRVPFMDNDLVDFAVKCPLSLKLNNLSQVSKFDENLPGLKTERFFQKTNDGKNILRSMMRRHVPLNVTEAVKQGFSAPDASWFKGESIGFVERTLLGKDTRLREFFDQKTVKDLVRSHTNGERNRRLLIWSLLNFEQWCQEFL